MAGDKRKVQEINAGSMADIAFLLLIFFLVATTMNTDTGLTRVLPPMPDPNQKQEDVKVKERNLLLVFVSKGNNIMAGGQQMDIHQLKDKAKEFISTASLPDVIFMILFFFMISTTMRDQELLVRYKLPTATEVQKLEKKSLVSFIHIGQPTPIMQAKFGTAPRIQLNDSYRTEKDILDFIAAERDKLNESDRALMTVCLKADDQTKMGIITDVKQELRRANALKLSYAASKSMGY